MAFIDWNRVDMDFRFGARVEEMTDRFILVHARAVLLLWFFLAVGGDCFDVSESLYVGSGV